jgi:hypothetical protein
VTYFQDVGLRDSAALDAFARLRVSNPDTQFDSQSQYDLDDDWTWQESLTGAATITHLPNESAAQLSNTTASGDIAIRQTKRYFRYRPGKSQLILMTGVLGAGSANVEQVMGYGDDDDGIFLVGKSDGLYMRLRTSTSGSPVDTDVAQASWNEDPLDGTGPSGVTVSRTDIIILAIDLEWLSAGRVRVSVVQNGRYHVAHTWVNEGGDTPYMKTANLPVRYSLENTGAASATDLKAICCTVISEGGSAVETGRIHAAGNNTTTRTASSGTRLATLTIRPKATFNGIANRALISPLSGEVYVSGNVDAYWELILNGSIGGSPSYASVEADSLVEYDVAGTTITGGHVLAAGYSPSSKGASSPGTINFGDLGLTSFGLTLDYAGTGQDTLTLATSGIGGNSTVAAALTWAEVR